MGGEDNHAYQWKLHVDRVAGPNQSGFRAILEGLDGLVISYAIRFHFPVSNSIAEYEVLINEIQLAMGIGVNKLNVLNDSQLVINQVRGVYEAQYETMRQYLAQMREL